MLTYGFSRGRAGPGAANTAATTCLITGTAISPTIPTILPTIPIIPTTIPIIIPTILPTIPTVFPTIIPTLIPNIRTIIPTSPTLGVLGNHRELLEEPSA